MQHSLAIVLLSSYPGVSTMQTTKLSSKGQVIIPKALRASHQRQAGMELLAIRPQSAADIEMALQRDVRKKWRDHD